MQVVGPVRQSKIGDFSQPDPRFVEPQGREQPLLAGSYQPQL